MLSTCFGRLVVFIDDDYVSCGFSFLVKLLDDFLFIDGLPWFGDL
jgi:hypothetical protein